MKKSELKQIIKEEIQSLLKEERKFEEGDKVKVIKQGYSDSGKTGTVIDYSPSETFFTIKFPNGNSGYFHESDLKLVKRPSL